MTNALFHKQIYDYFQWLVAKQATTPSQPETGEQIEATRTPNNAPTEQQDATSVEDKKSAASNKDDDSTSKNDGDKDVFAASDASQNAAADSPLDASKQQEASSGNSMNTTPSIKNIPSSEKTPAPKIGMKVLKALEEEFPELKAFPSGSINLQVTPFLVVAANCFFNQQRQQQQQAVMMHWNNNLRHQQQTIAIAANAGQANVTSKTGTNGSAVNPIAQANGLPPALAAAGVSPAFSAHQAAFFAQQAMNLKRPADPGPSPSAKRPRNVATPAKDRKDGLETEALKEKLAHKTKELRSLKQRMRRFEGKVHTLQEQKESTEKDAETLRHEKEQWEKEQAVKNKPTKGPAKPPLIQPKPAPPFPSSLDERLTVLEHFQKGFGHCRVPTKYESNPKLASWVMHLRQEYKNAKDKPDTWWYGRPAREVIAKLESMGFEWSLQPPNKTWDERFEALVKFKEEHGHARVTRRWKGDKSLGEWARNQRVAYNKGKLDPEKAEHLRELGFELSLKEQLPTWEENYEQLVEFQRENGDTNVPDPLLPGKKAELEEEDPDAQDAHNKEQAFRRWVEAQRKNYHTKYKKNIKCPLDDVKIRKLNFLGFDWGDEEQYETKWRVQAWEERFRQLEKFKERHGHSRIPRRWKEDPSLGEWGRNQRVLYNEGKLKGDRLLRLHEIGYPLQLDEVKRQEQLNRKRE